MDTLNKKKLYFNLITQLLIVIFSILLFCLNNFIITAMYFLTYKTIMESYIEFLTSISLVIVITGSFCSLCIPLFYPFVAFSTYKQLKDKPLSNFQKTCIKIFRLLSIAVLIEVLVIIIWIIMVQLLPLTIQEDVIIRGKRRGYKSKRLSADK